MSVNAVVHQFYDLSRIVGLRDRLRCPFCNVVGTYKPHGGWLDGSDKRKVRRWLCKWCGYYHGPEGRKLAVMGDGQWELQDDCPAGTTPREAVAMTMGRRVNPWFG